MIPFSNTTLLFQSKLQTKADTASPKPFILTINDRLLHLSNVEILSDHVRDISKDSDQYGTADHVHRRFLVNNPPKLDDYFAAMRYKCISELRPVPVVSMSAIFHMFLHRVLEAIEAIYSRTFLYALIKMIESTKQNSSRRELLSCRSSNKL